MRSRHKHYMKPDSRRPWEIFRLSGLKASPFLIRAPAILALVRGRGVRKTNRDSAISFLFESS